MRLYRKEKLARVVRDVVCEAIAHKLHDPRVDPLTTVTRVEMTGDLLIAKVFLTVHGGGTVERRTLSGIQNAAGFLQRQVAQELQIRHCPTLRFDIDHGIIGARRTMELLAENLRQDPNLADTCEDAGESPAETRAECPAESHESDSEARSANRSPDDTQEVDR